MAHADRLPISLLPLLHPVDAESTELNSHLSFESSASSARVVPPTAGSGVPASGAEVSELLEDLGYSSTANAKCLVEVFGQFGVIDALCVAHIVGMMARTATGLDDSLSLYGAFSTAVSGKYLEYDAKFDADKDDASVKALTEWNLTSLIDALKEVSPTLSWTDVFSKLDTPDLQLPGPASLTLITSLHRRTINTPLPVTYLLGPWRNVDAQLQAAALMLSSAVRGSSDLDWSAGERVSARIPAGSVTKPSCSRGRASSSPAVYCGYLRMGYTRPCRIYSRRLLAAALSCCLARCYRWRPQAARARRAFRYESSAFPPAPPLSLSLALHLLHNPPLSPLPFPPPFPFSVGDARAAPPPLYRLRFARGHAQIGVGAPAECHPPGHGPAASAAAPEPIAPTRPGAVVWRVGGDLEDAAVQLHHRPRRRRASEGADTAGCVGGGVLTARRRDQPHLCKRRACIREGEAAGRKRTALAASSGRQCSLR